MNVKTGAAAVFLSLVTVAGANEPLLMPLGEAWAKNSINTTNFRQDSITTAGDKQFASYYNPSGNVVIAERMIGQTDWKLTVTPLKAQKIADAHNSISIMADGEGYLHLSWDHHNNPLRYARSKSPATADFEMAAMTGQNEKSVSYPSFSNWPAAICCSCTAMGPAATATWY